MDVTHITRTNVAFVCLSVSPARGPATSESGTDNNYCFAVFATDPRKGSFQF
jgi:hypothetical protein